MYVSKNNKYYTATVSLGSRSARFHQTNIPQSPPSYHQLKLLKNISFNATNDMFGRLPLPPHSAPAIANDNLYTVTMTDM